MSRPRELLSDYARGALPEAEAVRLEEHLLSCPSCRAEVHEVREGFVDLVERLPAAEAPPGAWNGILGRVRHKRTRSGRWFAWTVAAAVLLTAVVGALLMADLVGRAVLANREADTVARWLARDDVQRISMGRDVGGGAGSVLLLPDGRALFVLEEMPGRGRSYQAWGHRDGAAESLGVSERPVFEVNVGADHEALWLSREPRGGSETPTEPLGWAPL